MNEYASRGIYLVVYLLIVFIFTMIAASIVSHYQDLPYGQVLSYVLIGALGTLFYRLGSLIVFSYVFLLVSFLYLQTIQTGTKNAAHLVSISAGFATTAFFLSILEYIVPIYVARHFHVHPGLEPQLMRDRVFDQRLNAIEQKQFSVAPIEVEPPRTPPPIQNVNYPRTFIHKRT